MSNNNSIGARPLIERIKDGLTLSDYASRNLTLKKASGRSGELTGLCPFHDESTPSFYVSTEKHTYYCHGCQATGNVINLYAHLNGLDYQEAKMELGRELGVVDENLLVVDSVMLDAAMKFQAQLRRKEDALSYLISERNLTPEILYRFQVGFCWGLEFKDSSEAHKEKAMEYGLLRAATDRTPSKSYMAGRITFPVRNRLGHVVGFGGRLVPSDRPAFGPKYLNSPETKLFQKSELLYGAYEAEGAIQREGHVVIVEGFVDVITLHQYGIENTVGVMGAYASESAFSCLWTLTKKIVFCLDGDEAGKTGTLKSVLAAAPSMPKGCEIVVVTLPKDTDPDEFVIENGKDAFRKLCEDGMPLSRFLLNNALSKFDISYPEGRVAFVDEAVKIGNKFLSAPEIAVQIVAEAKSICAGGLAAYAINGGDICETVDVELLKDAIALLTSALSLRSH